MTVSQIIEKDTVVAGNVLKLVNSAMYGRRSPVTSIRNASSLLGMNRLRNAVLGMSITRMWNQLKVPPTWSTARFNLHSVGVAILSDMLAQRVVAEFPEGAFLAGLFHDVGKMLIAIVLRPEYERIMALSLESGRPWVDCEKEVLGFTHADLSSDVVKAWKMPDAIRSAVEDHHSDSNRQNIPHGTLPLAALIHTADGYVNKKGITIEKDQKSDPDASNPLDALGLTHQAELIEDFFAEYDSLTAFFR